jgi:hypothetical protein
MTCTSFPSLNLKILEFFQALVVCGTVGPTVLCISVLNIEYEIGTPETSTIEVDKWEKGGRTE